MSNENRKILQGAKTRAKLIGVARSLFANGYDAVGTPEIVSAANVTRGALYHHFDDKRALFQAAVEEVARDLTRRIDDVAERASSPVDAIVEGCKAFLACAGNRETRQIFLVDAPAVLGWKTWREIDARYGLGSLKEGLQACAAAGLIAPHRVDTLAHWISGALNELVFMLAEEEDQESATVKRLLNDVDRLVRGMISASK